MDIEYWQNASSFVSGIIFFAGLMRYALTVKRGSTKPTMSSWLVWLSLDIATVFGMTMKGVYEGQAIAAAAGSLTVVITALIYGSKRKPWELLDCVCLGIGFLGLVLWQTLDNAVWCIVAGQAGIFVGSIPTFKNALVHPEEEDRVAWMMYFVSCWFALLAIKKMTLADALQPINFTVIETAVVYVLFFHKKTSTVGR